MKSHGTNSKNKQNKANLKADTHSVIDALELPKDLLLGMPLLSLEGNRSVCITNHRGLVRYSRELIVVAARNGNIQISGRELLIPKFTSEVIEIRGYLEGVTFL